MTKAGRFKMAAVFAALAVVYAYIATTEKETAGVFAHIWGAVGFTILTLVFCVKAIRSR